MAVQTDTDLPLRYVVLRHDGIASPHFDLMFETSPGSERLRTFRCPDWPLESVRVIEQLADHRRAYLSYEGPISGDRGWVTRVEEGTVSQWTTPQEAMAPEPTRFQIELLPLGMTDSKRSFILRSHSDCKWQLEPLGA